MIFHAPQVKHQPGRPETTFHSPERVGREDGGSQLRSNVLNGLRSEDDNVNVRRLRADSQDPLQQQITQQASHDVGIPLRREQPEDAAKVATLLGTLKIP